MKYINFSSQSSLQKVLISIDNRQYDSFYVLLNGNNHYVRSCTISAQNIIIFNCDTSTFYYCNKLQKCNYLSRIATNPSCQPYEDWAATFSRTNRKKGNWIEIWAGYFSKMEKYKNRTWNQNFLVRAEETESISSCFKMMY